MGEVVVEGELVVVVVVVEEREHFVEFVVVGVEGCFVAVLSESSPCGVVVYVVFGFDGL